MSRDREGRVGSGAAAGGPPPAGASAWWKPLASGVPAGEPGGRGAGLRTEAVVGSTGIAKAPPLLFAGHGFERLADGGHRGRLAVGQEVELLRLRRWHGQGRRLVRAGGGLGWPGG